MSIITHPCIYQTAILYIIIHVHCVSETRLFVRLVLLPLSIRKLHSATRFFLSHMLTNLSKRRLQQLLEQHSPAEFAFSERLSSTFSLEASLPQSEYRNVKVRSLL